MSVQDKVTVYKWSEMPRQELWEGKLSRTALRTDQSLVCYNWFAPGTRRAEPHSHPFDQLVMVVEGRMYLEVDGKVFEMGPGTSARVPPGVPHTAWPIGDDAVLNIDVFGPAREDYLFLAAHQKSDFSKTEWADAPESRTLGVVSKPAA